MDMGVLNKGVAMAAGNVVALCPLVDVEQDAKPIADIYRNLGTVSAEQVVARALGEVAMTMSSIAEQVNLRDMTDLTRQIRKLQSRAENLGMITLARVSGDARICLERGDSTAFSAVWARLIRVTERTLVSERQSFDNKQS